MVVKVTDHSKALKQSLSLLVKKDVLVGVPAGSANFGRDGDKIDNASIGYINEFGAPEQNIPSRPHLIPGVEAVKSAIVNQMRKGILAALNGDKNGVEQAQIIAGQTAVSSVQQMITERLSPPLTEKTIQTRQRRKERRRTDANPRPLIDTGNYLKSITYVIR